MRVGKTDYLDNVNGFRLAEGVGQHGQEMRLGGVGTLELVQCVQCVALGASEIETRIVCHREFRTLLCLFVSK